MDILATDEEFDFRYCEDCKKEVSDDDKSDHDMVCMQCTEDAVNYLWKLFNTDDLLHTMNMRHPCENEIKRFYTSEILFYNKKNFIYYGTKYDAAYKMFQKGDTWYHPQVVSNFILNGAATRKDMYDKFLKDLMEQVILVEGIEC